MLGFLKFLIVIVLAALGAAFAVANSTAVQIDLGLYRPTAPLSVLLLLSLGVGLIFGGLASSVYYLRFKRENIALKRQRKIVEQQQASAAPRLSNQ
jgi:uncharacterized membrane protein YciS (DUF1049 family)